MRKNRNPKKIAANKREEHESASLSLKIRFLLFFRGFLRKEP